MGKLKKNLVFVCKTYSGDFDKFVKMYESFTLYNKDDIPLYISAPASDVQMFESYVKSGANVITDESYADKYFVDEEYWSLSKGYLNQEICKLSFWENNYAENYFFVDSDAYFIRPFYQSDFIAKDGTPYSVLVMDKDLQMQSYYKEFGAWRKSQIQKIFNAVGLDDERLLTCHGMTIMNSRVLSDFKMNYMQKNKLDYKDLLKVSPYEFTWYNVWLQKSGVIKVLNVEPFFKTFHMKEEYVFSKLGLVSEKDIASQYLGIVLNSNWNKKKTTSYQDQGLKHKILNRLLGLVG